MAMSSVAKKIMYRRHRAFKELFNLDNRNAETVLACIKKKCYVENTFHTNPIEHARRQGRREVWDLIMQFRDLTSDQIAYLTENI